MRFIETNGVVLMELVRANLVPVAFNNGRHPPPPHRAVRDGEGSTRRTCVVRVPERMEIASGRSAVESMFCDVPQAIFMFGNSLLVETGDQCEIAERSVKHGNVAPITWLDERLHSLLPSRPPAALSTRSREVEERITL